MSFRVFVDDHETGRCRGQPPAPNANAPTLPRIDVELGNKFALFGEFDDFAGLRRIALKPHRQFAVSKSPLGANANASGWAQVFVTENGRAIARRSGPGNSARDREYQVISRRCDMKDIFPGVVRRAPSGPESAPLRWA